MKKLPDLQKRTKKIPLPHSIREVTEVCLISKEPGKVVKQKLQDAGVTQIAKVCEFFDSMIDMKVIQVSGLC